MSVLSSSSDIEMESYRNRVDLSIDSLQSSMLPSLAVNGKIYDNVYSLKMYKNALYLNNNDTATRFLNREYGVIQLVFPDGAKIVRAE